MDKNMERLLEKVFVQYQASDLPLDEFIINYLSEMRQERSGAGIGSIKNCSWRYRSSLCRHQGRQEPGERPTVLFTQNLRWSIQER